MSATIVPVSIAGGLMEFHCPACGVPVLVAEEGLAEDLCKHVVAVVDWVDQLTVGDAVGADQAEQLEAAYEEGGLADLAGKLPATAAAFEFTEPARGGGHTGTTLIIAVDFAAAAA